MKNQKLAKVIRQWDAFIKGKNVVLTVVNPDSSNRKARIVRMKAKDYGWTLPPKPGSKEATQSN